ncbi:MAG: hypothetical protein D6744_00215, partial [Planctomycetota bacterium]
GSIGAPASGKATAVAQNAGQSYRVVAQSAETMEIYTADTDENGDFSIELPEGEDGELFMVAVVGPDGKPAGPVVLDEKESGAEGLTGLELNGQADLGTIQVPDDPSTGPLTPGDDADLGDSGVAEDVVVRVDENGVPLGVPTLGRGDDAMGDPTNNPRQQCDRDRDGMIDIFDADDDGDGTIDDFDSEHPVPAWEADGLIINFFMNLKIDDTKAQAYFSGDTTAIADSLQHDTVITFEVKDNGSLTKNISAVRIIGPPAPAPSYLTTATVLGSGALWSDSGYALNPDGTNHFQQWVVPNDFMSTGDTFTVEVTFDDGSKKVYSRMINYVFKSIPKVTQTGDPNSVTAYTGPTTIMFDGSRDVVLYWNPPVDDFGVQLVGLDYFFEVFYYDASGAQINGIDGAATWPSPPANWNVQNLNYEVSGASLGTPTGGEFNVTLPKEIFVDTVQTSGGPVAVSRYKIDIAAQNNGNNAALMLPFEKK